MDKIPENIQSGNSLYTKPQSELISRAFINSFVAVIWRHNWLTTILYTHHNKLPIIDDEINKCLQFNIFDEAGIGNELKPYFKSCLFYGKLYSEECKDNKHLTRILNIFTEAYNNEINDPDYAVDFIMNYGLTIFKNNDYIIELLKMNKKFNPTNIKDNSPCSCNLCLSVNKYQVHKETVNCQDSYMDIIIQGMMKALD